MSHRVAGKENVTCNTGLQNQGSWQKQDQENVFLVHFEALISKIALIFLYHVRIFCGCNVYVFKKTHHFEIV